MKKQPKIEYTGPLTGVEEFSLEFTGDSTKKAIQQIWESESEMKERISCRDQKNKQ